MFVTDNLIFCQWSPTFLTHILRSVDKFDIKSSFTLLCVFSDSDDKVTVSSQEVQAELPKGML